jgi:hypothetical protein
MFCRYLLGVEERCSSAKQDKLARMLFGFGRLTMTAGLSCVISHAAVLQYHYGRVFVRFLGKHLVVSIGALGTVSLEADIECII